MAINQCDYMFVPYNECFILYHIPSSSIVKVPKAVAEEMMCDKPKADGIAEELIKSLDNAKKVDISIDRNPEKGRLNNLVMLSADTCNLRCRYCFADAGTFGKISGKTMNFEQYRRIILKLLEIYPRGISSVNFFGGEPLLGFREIKKFIEYCYDLFDERNISRPFFSLITNGTIMNGEILDFLNQYKVGVTISIDGPKEINDFARVAYDGSSVYEKIKKTMNLINSKPRKFILAAELTVHKNHVMNYKKGSAKEWIQDVMSMGFDSAMIGPVESNARELAIGEHERASYREMYREFVDYWFENMTAESCNVFAWDLINMIRALVSKKYVKDCTSGRNAFMVNGEGDIYPCQLFYESRAYKLGNCYNGLEKDEFFNRGVEVAGSHRLNVEQCRNCHARYVCNVWCRGFNYKVNGDMHSTLKVRCWAETAILEQVLINLVRIREDENKYRNFTRNIKTINEKYNKINILRSKTDNYDTD